MRPDVERHLDAEARSDLEAERSRHSGVIDRLHLTDPAAVIAECELHGKNLEQILQAFARRRGTVR